MPHERMPEVPPVPEPYKRLSEEDFQKVGRKVVGSGSMSIVEVFPGKEEKVAAHPASLASGILAKQTFYSHRILNTLFPKHIPRIHAAFVNSQERRGGTVRERIQVERDGYSVDEQEADPSKAFRSAVEEELRKIGINTEGFDHYDKNFGVGSDGYEKYLDINPYIGREFVKNRRKLIDYMKAGGYSDSDIQQVNISIDRLTSDHLDGWRSKTYD